MAWGVVAGDLGWVVFSVVLVTAFADRFSSLGVWLIVDIAVAVGLFAVLQARGLLKSSDMVVG